MLASRPPLKKKHQKLARHLRLPRRCVRVASRRECLEVFGYAPGTVPPVGHGPHTALVVDFRLGNACVAAPGRRPEASAEIVFGAGDDRLELGLTFEQLMRLMGSGDGRRGAAVADVAEAMAGGDSGGGGDHAVPRPPPPPLLPPPSPERVLQPLATAPKFLVDTMCGRLARWLRCLGLDAESLDAATERLLVVAAAAAAGATAAADDLLLSSSSSSSSSSLLLAVARAAASADSAAAAAAAPAKKAGAAPSAELVAAQRRRDLRLLVAEHHARAEGRTLLTRDAQLATSREGLSLGALLLASDEAVAQLAELAAHFGRGLLESRVRGGGGGDVGGGGGASSLLLTRCSACNRADYARLSREEASGLVPPRVLDAVDEFWRCGPCGRVVWWGPKSDRAVADMRERVAQALAMLDQRRAAMRSGGAMKSGELGPSNSL